ncbi:MAG: lysyl oxidase family protein [Anaerolineales bacterium]|nr:lysyl oxidase family protein [Anaerolineales bacterium]
MGISVRFSRIVFGLLLGGLVIATGVVGRLEPVHARSHTDPAPTPDGSTAADSDVPVKLLLPDLITEEVGDLRLLYDPNTGSRLLRFSNTVANIGLGPVELRGRPASQVGRFRVLQRLYGSNGRVLAEPLVGEIIFHRGHEHWHLSSFASYEVWHATREAQPTHPARVRDKISYCLFDHRPGSETSPDPVYEDCTPELQGLSPGWTDTYAAHIADQWVDLSGLKDGVYVLRSVVNPRGVIREETRQNNEFLLAFQLQGASIRRVPVHPDPWDHLAGHPQPR